MLPAWQPDSPIDVIFFDCDGTLSTLEGIDVLAEYNGVGPIVKALTQQAMGIAGITPELYQKRLELVQPTQDQIYQLGQAYYDKRTIDVVPVIELLQRLNKKIYIISAGLRPAVEIFADLLGINRERVIAVDIKFDINGNFLRYDHHSPLLHQTGKRDIVSAFKQSSLYIGDGLNDQMTSEVVSRFIGFGGTFYRENIAALCQYYIKNPSLAPLINLSLTAQEITSLSPEEKTLYLKGIEMIQVGDVIIQ